jgi:hypothetical protein
LSQVIDRWEALPDPVRAGILAMVQAAANSTSPGKGKSEPQHDASMRK